MSTQRAEAPGASTASHEPVPSGGRLAIIGVAVVLGGLLRIWAARGDLWMDEIWSLVLVADAETVSDVFRIRHDNNHPLNSLFLWMFGSGRAAWVYRLPAVLAGAGSIVAVGMWSRSLWQCATACFVFAVSFPLIQYTSEARGYAFAILSACLAGMLLHGTIRRRSTWRDWIFGLVSGFGLLAHATFVTAYFGLFAWSLFEAVKRRESGGRSPIAWLARCHLIPIVVAGGLYLGFLQGMTIGGGDSHGWSGVIARSMSLSLGLDPTGWGLSLAAIVAVAAFAAGCVVVAREGSTEWVCLAVAGVVAPVVLLLATQPDILYPRYFVVAGVFWLVGFSRLIAAILAARDIPPKMIGGALLLAFLATNGYRVVRLATIGRGQYSAATEYVIEHTDKPRVSIGSDHDLRNPLVLSHHLQRIAPTRRLVYYEQREWPRAGVDWVFVHSFEREFLPNSILVDMRGGKYDLVRVFPYAGLSGWHWALYHRRAADR